MAMYWDPDRHDETVTTTSKALIAKHELGDVMGMAYCLEIHGWLAARAGRDVGPPGCSARPNRSGNGPRPAGRHGGPARGPSGGDGQGPGGFVGKRFQTVFDEAGRHPVEQLVSFAVSDADEPTAEGARWRMPGQLTFREAEIADLAARGMSNRQIAEHLFISKRTVDAHLDHIYAKLGISSRVELLNALQLTRPNLP